MVSIEPGIPSSAPKGDDEPYDIPLETKIASVWQGYFLYMRDVALGALKPTGTVFGSFRKKTGFDFEASQLVISDLVISKTQQDLFDLMQEAANIEATNTVDLLRLEILATGFPVAILDEYIAQLSVDAGFVDVSAIEFLEDETVALTNKKADDVFQQVRGIVSDGFRDGDDFEQMATRISSMSPFQGKRAEVIARTESVRAANEGRLSTFRKNDSVLNGYRSSAFIDTRTGELDLAMDGATFSNGHIPTNDIAARNPGARIPYHTSCRCVYVPIVKPPQEADFLGPEAEALL